MLVQLEAGVLDVAKGPAPNDYARYKSDPAYQAILHSVSGNYFLFGLNLSIPPLENRQVRQALNYALDRARMVQTALGGFAEPRVLPWPSSSVAYDPAEAARYPFDLDRAAALLSAAGLSGFETELTYPINPEYQAMAQIYQADLKKIGVSLNLKPLETAAWNNYVISTKTWGLSFAGAPPANLHPGTILSRVWTSPASNICNFRSDAWTDLAARVAAEADPARLKTLSLELDRFLLDESWFIPVTSAPPKLASRAGIGGLQFDATDTPTYPGAWVASA
jgi:peptide/nickel transport system substrate-binding protein